MSVSYNIIIFSVDELWLKGTNKGLFTKSLKKHVKKVVKAFHDFPFEYEIDGSRHIIKSSEPFCGEVFERLACVPGLHSFVKAKEVEKDIEKIKGESLSLMKATLGQKASFKVTAKRSDKSFPQNSESIAREVGGFLKANADNVKVSLKEFEWELRVHIQSSFAYISCERIIGVGGLPVGSNGKMLTLLSGGIDSPVAAYQMAKRGIEQGFIFFHAYPYVGDEVLEKIKVLAQKTARYMFQGPLFVVPFGKVQEKIIENCPEAYRTLFFRIYMIKTAKLLAEKMNYQALITGDALGQVSSQTLGNLMAIDRCFPEVSIFRPLIGFNKVEIQDVARSIDTYETSIIPHDDACSIIAPKKPTTNANVNKCLNFFKEFPLDEVIEESLRSVQKYVFNQRGKYRTYGFEDLSR